MKEIPWVNYWSKFWKKKGTTLGSSGPLAPMKSLDSFGTWYHSFESLGVSVVQREGIYKVNQKCKEGIILGYLRLAIEKSKKSFSDTPSALELFCADGYYAAHARQMGCGRVTGIDLDQSSIQQAQAMFALLFGLPGEFLVADVVSFVPIEAYDIVLCSGGLYHVLDPRKLLEDCLAKFSKRFLIVQSVVTLEHEEEDYFIAPAPGRRHGCRFTSAFLRKMLQQVGWQIIDSHFNQLEANKRLCDRGSAYFFCQKD